MSEITKLRARSSTDFRDRTENNPNRNKIGTRCRSGLHGAVPSNGNWQQTATAAWPMAQVRVKENEGLRIHIPREHGSC